MDVRQLLRSTLRERRKKLSLCDQEKASKLITQQLIQYTPFQQSRHFAGYVAVQKEIDPTPILKIVRQSHKHCYLPVVQETKLLFVRYEKNAMFTKNRFGIPEPSLSEQTSIIAPQHLDIVLVPLLGFTFNGERLGMGGGFYDRCFKFLLDDIRPAKPHLIGLAYEWQKMKSFISSPWDVPLNAIVTEEKIYLNAQISSS